jgi:hypothetical protein
MTELLNLAHMPWWAWLAWWFVTFFALYRTEQRRATSADAAATVISSLFIASVLMVVHAVGHAWALQPAWGWTLLAASFLMMLFSASRVVFGLIFVMLGVGLLTSNFGVAWIPPLASLLLCLSWLALVWALLRSRPKRLTRPDDADATAALHARLDQPDAQDGADKYTRE